MNYEESLEYIHSINWCFCKPGLERIAELCSRLGDPQKELKFVHVAGTNGKGSFCAMLESVLRASGYKTGLYTSPYITVFNERMRICGENISNDELAEITTQIRPIADAMEDRPTEFELITAVAFEYFKRNGCDIVVLEAGMGGRLDSTNIIERSLLSVITGISLDHTSFLGDTVAKIAAEKAGIIKKGCPVLFGGEDAEADTVIKNKAELEDSKFYEVDHSSISVKKMTLEGTVFDFGEHKEMEISLLGTYQPQNASSVIKAVEILRERGINVPDKALRDGLAAARWQARFEIISKEPLVIFDGAHNPQGISEAVKSIKTYFGDKKVFVLTGVLKDKDYKFIAKELSCVASKAFTITPENPRALDAAAYADELSREGVSAKPFDDIQKAFEFAKKEAQSSDTPLVCLGSLYLYSSINKKDNNNCFKEKSK